MIKNMKYSIICRCKILLYASLLSLPLALSVYAEVDRIVAVVEDDVIMSSELTHRITMLKAKLAGQSTQLPSDQVLQRQVLERMIVEQLQLQLAQRSGLKVTDEALRGSMQQLARNNGMDLDAFRRAVQAEGISPAQFRQDLRNEMIIGRLRNAAVSSQVKVTDREVEHFMATQGKDYFEQGKQFHLAHILVATPEFPVSAQIQAAQEKAMRVVKDIHAGLDFRQAALTTSSGTQALNGGDLGWRKLSQIPTLFVDEVKTMKAGEVRGPLRSPSGFHILKLVGVKGATEKHIVNQTHARHILIKTTELITDDDARDKLLKLKQRLSDGDDFATLARAHSDDTVSALKGGDLGWVTPGAFVPSFARAMNALPIKQISDPVQTQFGWHLIEVLERKARDDTEAYRKHQAREALRARKIEEETELWLRRMRDEAYVEVRLKQ